MAASGAVPGGENASTPEPALRRSSGNPRWASPCDQLKPASAALAAPASAAPSPAPAGNNDPRSVLPATSFSPSQARGAVERGLALLAEQLKGEEAKIIAAQAAATSVNRALRGEVAALKAELAESQAALGREREFVRAAHARRCWCTICVVKY